MEIYGKEIKLNEDGYLDDFTLWDNKIAEFFAKELGINPLTENHWKIIYFIREEFKSNKEIPSIRKINRESGVNIKEFYQLFPDGPLKKAAKIAGLPKPKNCI